MPCIKKMVMRGFKSFARETTINFDPHMNCVVGPNGSGKSARWDTEILLASGKIKPIGEIVEESLKSANKIRKLDDGLLTYENPLNISVLSLDTKSMKIKEGAVKAFIKRDGEPNLFTIKTKTGKEVTTTSCHPILIYKNGEIVSEVVGNLKSGDLIATPNILNLCEKKEGIKINGLVHDLDPIKLARFLGYIVGDGCIIPNSRIDFVNADREILEDYKGIISSFGFSVGEGNRKGSIAKNIYLYSKNLSNGLVTFFNEKYKKEGKHIPEEILFSSKQILSNFLGALFDCDASVRKDNPTFEYCTMSRKLAEGVILGLLRFGIVARRITKTKCATNTREKIKREYFYILVEGKEKITKLYEQINLKCEHKKELLKKWAENKIVSNTNNDLLPQDVNIYIKELVNLLGIKIKKIRRQYPLLAAYVENRCNPSREGVKRILGLFKSRLSNLVSSYDNLFLEQVTLIKFMDLMGLSSWDTSDKIGLHKNTIRNIWAKQVFKARPENIVKLENYLKMIYLNRMIKINKIMSILTRLTESEIFWDKISEIKKVKGEDYVYDIEVEGNHNFIANNIFVHNSNITDALCFVLGRLSIKSMRAAKASHLIFAGNKQYKRANEAFVEIIFDNEDKTFALDEKEIKIRRIVRHNGQSVYKINNETKTRQEVLELLGQAGIDPHGFNIVLQGEIERFVKMPAEERRKIIEEVAGISVYEMRKEKSLKELEKTEEKLRQINTVLRERTNYLKNLENEREQALRFKKLEEGVKQCRASIINRNLQDRKKEFEEINKKIEEKRQEVNKKNEIIIKTQNEIALLNEKIDNISKTIQKSSGLEQDNLMEELTQLKQEIAGSTARKENFENQLNELGRRENALKEAIKSSEIEISDMAKEKGKNKKKQLEDKKKQLDELDELKRKTYLLKSSLSSLNLQVEDKKKQIQRLKNESNFILDQIQDIESGIKIKNSLSEHQSAMIKLRQSIKGDEESSVKLESILLEKEKEIAVRKQQIEKAEKIKSGVQKLDICPLCQTKMTPEHMKKVIEKSDVSISKNKEKISVSEKQIIDFKNKIQNLKKRRLAYESEISTREIDIIKLQTIEDKKQQLKRNSEQINIYEKEFSEIQQKLKMTENNFSKIKISEEDYENLKLEVNELQRSEERDLGIEITTKQRELDRTKLAIKQILRDKESIQENLSDLEADLEEKQKEAEDKEKQAAYLKQKYQKMFGQKNELQDKARMFESNLMRQQNEKSLSENDINNLKINQAEISAKKQNLEEELKEFMNVQFINLPVEKLKERLNHNSEILARIGSVNLRALEVYDNIKAEYDKIREKVEQLEKEKADILQIIEQIDKKKKRTFMQTLREINILFSRNFNQLSEKGEVILEPQNKEDIFAAGLDITVKTGIGKYFDITSLSGGEQCLVALSLIFAIQEHKPYCFYIFDEIDAALDKRNSEKLAYLLRKYMKQGQYIIITHNDALISESSNVIYGVSMQEGVSKVLSLEV